MESLNTRDARTASVVESCRLYDEAANPYRRRRLSAADYHYLWRVREVAVLCEDDIERFLHMLDERGLLAAHVSG